MEPRKNFLLRTFTDAGLYSTYTGTQYIDETSARIRLWSDYTITTAGPLTAEVANRAATWCVAAERLARIPMFVQRRSVIVELKEGAEFDVDAPTWTLTNDFQYQPGTQIKLANQALAGQRYANFYSVTDTWYNSHASAYIARGRSRGPRWQMFLWGAVCSDDVAPVAPGVVAAAEETVPVALDKTGALAGYCFPWMQWCYEQAPEVENAVDVEESGAWTRAGDGAPGAYSLKGISVRNKLKRWFLRRPPERNRLDALFLDADTFIQGACREMGFGDVGRAFERSTWQSPYDFAEVQLLYLASLWRDFADLCNFQVPANEPQWLGITLMGFARWADGGLPMFTGYGRPAEAQVRYQKQFYTPPAASALRLTVKRNRAQIFKCVNRLFAAWRWWRENRITEYSGGVVPQKIMGWNRDADGTPVANVTAPAHEPFVYGGYYSQQPSGPFFAGPFFTNDADAAAAGYPYRRQDAYQYDNSLLSQRQQAVIWYNRWQEWQDWAYSIIDALNWLELLLYPENTRRRLTLKEMEMPLPHTVTTDARPDTSPLQIDVVPQLVSHRKARPPWIRRPQVPQPQNEATIQTPPPPPLTAAQIKRQGDERRAYEKWKLQRVAMQKLAADWEIDYPARGVVAYRSASTDNVRYLNDDEGGDPTIPA